MDDVTDDAKGELRRIELLRGGPGGGAGRERRRLGLLPRRWCPVQW